MRRTRSSVIPFQALLFSPSHSLREDNSLCRREPDFVLNDVRPFGDVVEKEYSMWVLVKTALADGAHRGRLFGNLHPLAWQSFRGVEPPKTPHATGTVVAYCAPNLIRTDDGKIYRIDSTAPEHTWSSKFELPTLRNTIELPWPFGTWTE